MNPRGTHRTTKARSRGVLVWAVAASMTVPVYAQSVEPAQEIRPHTAPGWTFTPTVTVAWLYDTNVGLVDPGVGFEKQEDQLLLIIPGGDLDFLGRYTRFSAGYHGSLLRYRTLDALNAYQQRGSVSLTHRASRWMTLFARESLHRAPTTDEVELNGVPFRRVGTTTNNAAGGVDLALSKLTSMRASYELIQVQFERAEVAGFLQGGVAHGLNLDLRRRFTDRLSFGGTYAVRFATLDIANPPELGLPAADSAVRFQNAGATLGYELSPTLSLSTAVGAAILTDSRRGESHVGPFVRLGLTRTGERLLTTLAYERAFVPTFGFAASSMSEQFRAGLHMPVARNRVYVRANAAWRRTDPIVAEELALDSLWARSTVGVALARALRLESYYAYTRQDSRIPGGLVVRHRLGAQVVLGQPMRIH